MRHEKTQLFPRLPKRLRQPSKEVLREQLRLAADRIIEQGEQIERHAERQRIARWWRRLFRRG